AREGHPVVRGGKGTTEPCSYPTRYFATIDNIFEDYRAVTTRGNLMKMRMIRTVRPLLAWRKSFGLWLVLCTVPASCSRLPPIDAAGGSSHAQATDLDSVPAATQVASQPGVLRVLGGSNQPIAGALVCVLSGA